MLVIVSVQSPLRQQSAIYKMKLCEIASDGNKDEVQCLNGFNIRDKSSRFLSVNETTRNEL
ncbi:MAG: hypothetical protein LBQ66_12400 [Planctomycetaceae bacterium]|nr:hypothetical protein [Planctomycetaceae bacterium]